ncbi:MAG: hypothetical protein ACYCYF_14895 [Anaerolineae bacterium]
MTLYLPGVFNLNSLRFGPWCRACGTRVLFSAPPAGVPAPAAIRSTRPRLVLLISGSCASGKSTVSRLLAERHGLVQIDGDWVLHLRKAQLGTPVGTLEIDSELRLMAHGVTRMGMGAVIAHVVLPDAMAVYQSHFASYGIPWRPVILLPDRKVLLQRAASRRTWPHPTPAPWIDAFQEALSQAPVELRSCLYDNASEGPEQTAEAIWRMTRTVTGR